MVSGHIAREPYVDAASATAGDAIATPTGMYERDFGLREARQDVGFD
jgi:hypothetical protein